jgi:hypothetical protein
MVKIRIVAVSAALALGWGASSQVVAGNSMSGEQINTMMSGNTTYGKHTRKNKHGHSFKHADGAFVGWNNEDGKRTGTWRTQGNKYCRTPDGDSERCFELSDNGDGTYNMYIQPGNLIMPRKHVWTWTKVVPGNPENLK